jgi:hypothetical protein
MTIIVESGSGITNANSYVDVTYADAYHAEFGNTDWASIGNTEKESALIQASQSCDIQYGDKYRGVIQPTQNSTRKLLFPRMAFTDLYGMLWSGKVPTYLLNAVCEMALTKAGGGDITPLLNSEVLDSSEIKVGDVTVKKAFSHNAPQTELYTGMGKVEQILKPMLKSKSNNTVMFR